MHQVPFKPKGIRLLIHLYFTWRLLVLFRCFPRIHFLPPVAAVQRSHIYGKRSDNKEPRGNGREPTDADDPDGWEADCGTCGGEEVPDHVIASNNLGAPPLIYIQTIRVQTRETHHLRHALQKHHYHRKRHPTPLLLNAPPVNQHAAGDDDAHESDGGAKPVLGHACAPDANPFPDDVVGPAAAQKGTEEVAATGRDVEEAGLDGRREVEAWVQDVSYRCEEGVHVPDEGGGSEGHSQQVRISI